MKSAKIFIAFTFLLAFALQVLAQINQYPNEIEGFKFFNEGKLKNLKLLSSDKNDIRVIFGEKCENGCDYNEDWKIRFGYVSNNWSYRFIGANERLYKPKPELIGKLYDINFSPKKTILLADSLLIPKELNCRTRIAFEETRYRFRVCDDNERIIYKISDETTADKKIIKGQIILITYLPSEEESDNIYALVK